MVGCEIRGEFVEVWFRNRLGNAQQLLPYRAVLFGLGSAATLAATFWGSGTHRITQKRGRLRSRSRLSEDLIFFISA